MDKVQGKPTEIYAIVGIANTGEWGIVTVMLPDRPFPCVTLKKENAMRLLAIIELEMATHRMIGHTDVQVLKFTREAE